MTMPGLRILWQRLRDSLWFVPTLYVAAAAALAVVLIELHSVLQLDLSRAFPRLFGMSADGARGMLGAIATSVITVAGVAFSITIVALSLASTQYSPRVLRHFMNDRGTQSVLGVMVGVYVYCLLVLRTVRSADEGPPFLPTLAVLGALLLALLSVAMLIFFIHHVAASIQADAIIGRIDAETDAVIERLFPDPIGASPPAQALGAISLPQFPVTVTAAATGYVASVDGQRLLDIANAHDIVVELVPCIGDFVIADTPVARVAGCSALSREVERALQSVVALDRQRSMDQDPAYGVQQLVDIALKALSPGINDPTTAAACIDRLTALVIKLGGRRLPEPWRESDGVLRVIARGPSFGALATLAFDGITSQAASNRDATTLARLIDAQSRIAGTTDDARQRAVLRGRLALIDEAIATRIVLPSQRTALRERSDRAAACMA